MSVIGSLTAIPFAQQSPVPGVLLTFAGLCTVWGVLMFVFADRLVPWMLTGASVMGTIGITSVAVHVPEGTTFATGPVLYVIPVLQVGLLRGRREAWGQLAVAMTGYATGLAVVGMAPGAISLTVLPVLVTLAVLNAAVTRLRGRVQQLVTEVDRLFSELREQADRDALTGLLNRQGMVRVAACPDVLTAGTVLLLDVDHFTGVNETVGTSRATGCCATSVPCCGRSRGDRRWRCAWAARSSCSCCARPTPRPLSPAPTPCGARSARPCAGPTVPRSR